VLLDDGRLAFRASDLRLLTALNKALSVAQKEQPESDPFARPWGEPQLTYPIVQEWTTRFDCRVLPNLWRSSERQTTIERRGHKKGIVANRQLTTEELEQLFAPLAEEVRLRLVELSAGDEKLLWALRRKLFKELAYDERGKPLHRRKLKDLKRAEQNNKCAVCGGPLPAKYAVLDRLEAMAGYTAENTRLICQPCDTQVQTMRGYK
jgi:ribosomal protein L44E